MNWKIDNNIPIYIQVADCLKKDIAKGLFKPGDVLPSANSFAVQMKINPNAVQRAICKLAEDGVLVFRNDNKYYVSSDTSSNFMVKEMLIQKKVNEFIAAMRELGVADVEMTGLVVSRLGVNHDEYAD